jgi:hypothetical protein
MRTIGEIQAVVEDGRASSESLYLGATIEELALCVESQRILLESLRGTLEAVLKAIDHSRCLSDLNRIQVLAAEVCGDVDEALETEPGRWLEEAETGPKTGFRAD